MKRRRIVIGATLLMTAVLATNLTTRVPVSNAAIQREVQAVTVNTTLQRAGEGEAGDLMTMFKAGQLSGVSFKKGTRHRMFALVDRTQTSAAVSCDPKDVEFGSVERKDGSWLAVAICPKGTSAAAVAIPAWMRGKRAAHDDSAITCWENKELLMDVCYQVGTNPSGPVSQTREHILLARQVGVPAL